MPKHDIKVVDQADFISYCSDFAEKHCLELTEAVEIIVDKLMRAEMVAKKGIPIKGKINFCYLCGRCFRENTILRSQTQDHIFNKKSIRNAESNSANFYKIPCCKGCNRKKQKLELMFSGISKFGHPDNENADEALASLRGSRSGPLFFGEATPSDHRSAFHVSFTPTALDMLKRISKMHAAGFLLYDDITRLKVVEPRFYHKSTIRVSGVFNCLVALEKGILPVNMFKTASVVYSTTPRNADGPEFRIYGDGRFLIRYASQMMVEGYAIR